MGYGDHLCHIYHDRSKALELALAYVREGLGRGERCIYVTGDHPADEVLRGLEEAGVDVARERARGRLVVLGPEEYRPAGRFDAELMAERLRALLGDPEEEGFSGARIVVEMAWAREDPPPDRLLAWEERTNPFLRAIGRASALCMFDATRFPPAVLRAALRHHREILLEDRLSPNPFFQPEDLSRASDRDRRLLEWELEQIGRLRDEEEVRETAQRLQALIQAAPIAITAVDARGNVLLWSPSAERMFGWREEEVLGRPPPQVPPEKRQEFGAQLERVLRGDALKGVETQRRRRDGTLLDVSISTAALRDADGRIRGAVAMIEDITDWKRAERERERLLESERRSRGEAEATARAERALREAAEAVSGMFTIGEVNREIAWSAREATGADGGFVLRLRAEADELEVVAAAGAWAPPLGARVPYPGSLSEWVLEHDEPRLVPRLAEAERSLPGGVARRCPQCTALVLHLVDAGGAIGTLFLLRSPDRGPFRAEEMGRARTFASLAALGFRKIHLLEDAERRRVELQRLMATRDHLMRGFSHDVKNPLSAADGYLQLFELGVVGRVSDRQGEYLARIRRSIRSALDLIDDLLELARAEAGEIEVERNPVDLRAAAREAADEYRAQAEAKGLAVRLELPEELPVVRTDRSRVHQILGNLLSNAVKYTDRGGVVVRVAESGGAGAPRPGLWVRLDVADTGPGIPKEKQPDLFREFTRLKPGEKHGAGLGLAIGRRVARALGGDITLESEPGKGSIFTLWLPAAAEEERAGSSSP